MHKARQALHETGTTPLRVVWANQHDAPAGKHQPLHRHTCWELVYYLAGRVGCPLGNEIFESQPGMLMIVPPGEPHGEYAWTAYSCYAIGIEAPHVHMWPRRCFDNEQCSYARVCGTLISEWHGRDSFRDEMMTFLLGQLSVLLRREYEQLDMTPAEKIVQKAEGLCRQRFATSLRITDVARGVGVSADYLRDCFQQVRGYSPLTHVQAIRLEHALTYLRTSTITLETIANLCGYHSASHLSRHVKEATGRSPGSFRMTGNAPLTSGDRDALSSHASFDSIGTESDVPIWSF